MFVLRTLGSLELHADEIPVLSGRRKPLALLTYLARHSPRTVGRESLAALLWWESDAALARQSLRQTLSELRAVLGSAIVAEGALIGVDTTLLTLDVTLFAQDVAEKRWSDATMRWNGDFLRGLEDVGDESWRVWLEAERVALRAQLAVAFSQLAKAGAARGDWSEVRAVATRWRVALPGDERGAITLVNALRFGGRTAEAAGCYAECLTHLRDASGIEPSAEFLRIGADLTKEDLSPSPGSRALMTPDMVGRGDAFAVMTASWSRTRAGAGRVVLVTGDEGAGKTRLLREFGRHVRGEKLPNEVFESRAFAAERDQQWAAIRAWMLQMVNTPALAGAPPETLTVLAQIAPELRATFRHLPEPAAHADVAQAFCRAVTDVATVRPVVLILDDAAESDQTSAAAIAALVRRPPPRTLVVLSGRSGEWRNGLEPAALIGSDHVDQIEVGALKADESLEMLASMVPLDVEQAPTIAARLHQDSGGNPGQLSQLFTHLADVGLLAPNATGRWSLTAPLGIGNLPVPGVMRDALGERLAQLGTDARTLVDAASVAGPRLSGAMLEAISGLPAAQYQQALGELLLHRVLTEFTGAADSSGLLTFTTEATRRTAYERLAPSRRRALHRATLGALRRDANHAVVAPETIAHHRRLAGEDRWFRRPWVQVGAVAAVALAAIGGPAVARRASATVTKASMVLLADVQNDTGDPVFDRALLTAATVGLQQSQQIAVFPRVRVSQVLARMGRQRDDSALGESLAREVAERAAIPVVILLSIGGLDSTYELTARIIDPRAGRDLRALRERARGQREVLNGLDRLLVRVRRALGESAGELTTGAASLPLVTTSSLEALRAYADGVQAWTQGAVSVATQHFERAVAIDSNFALALTSLADVAYVARNNRRLGDQYLDRAKLQRARLTEREQLLLLAKEQQYRGTADAEIRIRQQLAERFPERDSWYNYGTALMRARRCREAGPPLQRALALDSLFTNALINIATCQQFTGNYRDAVTSYERVQRIDSLALTRGALNHEFGLALVHLELLDSASRVYQSMARRSALSHKQFGYRSLAYVRMLEGQYRNAADALDSAIIFAHAAGNQRVSEFRNHILLAQAAQSAGDSVRVGQALNGAWKLLSKFTPDPTFAFYAGYAFANARSLDRARVLLDTLNARARAGSRLDQTLRHLLQARIALVAGRPTEARALLTQASDTTMNGYRLALLSDTYEALGRADSALMAATQLTREMRVGDEQQDEWLRGFLRVGRLAERVGDAATARAAYAAIVARWKHGDTDHSQLVHARRALVRLGVVSGKGMAQRL